MKKLLLIRHGQTDYNLSRRYCGFSNPSLNEAGIAQAQALKKRLRELEIDAVYSSDLLRAIETARIALPDKSITKVEKLREYNFGVFEGLTYEEIMEEHADIYTKWIDNPSKQAIPGGDCFTLFSKRVREGLNSISSSNKGKAVALVTHSGPIRLILSDLLKYGSDKFWKIAQDNAALNVINYNDSSAEVEIINNQSFGSYEETF